MAPTTIRNSQLHNNMYATKMLRYINVVIIYCYDTSWNSGKHGAISGRPGILRQRESHWASLGPAEDLQPAPSRAKACREKLPPEQDEGGWTRKGFQDALPLSSRR